MYQEAKIARRLMEMLEQLRMEEINAVGTASTLCLQHIQFTNEFLNRLKEREMLLENVVESLWTAQEGLTDEIHAAMRIIKETFAWDISDMG